MTISVTITQMDAPLPPSSLVVTGIIAQPGGQAGATPLTGRTNIVTNVAAGAAVILQVGVWPERKALNRCGTGQALPVLPPVGMQIEGYGMNNPVNVVDGGNATFTWDGATTWRVS